jgi:hypothetical protein
MRLWTVGYGAWPASQRAQRLVEALEARRINHLIDVRLSPCASNPRPEHRYGPRPWNLQADGSGIVDLLGPPGITYEWLVELGNPQRQDPEQTILRNHLADPEGGWPVHRGLALLAQRVRSPGVVVALLCACGDPFRCHRSTIAQALNALHFAGELSVRDVGGG